MLKLKRFISLSLLIILLAGCSSAQAEPVMDSLAFTDALGRQVSIESPQRVAALMGGFAETWLLAGGELIAVTDDAVSERQLPLDGAVNLGFYTAPNMEELLAARPDFVLLSAQTQSHVALLDTLDNAGISAACFSVTHFSDYLQMLDICTDITGRKDLYRQNGLEVQTEIEQLLAGIHYDDAPTVLLLITHSGGAVVQRGDSMTGQMLEELGCVNIADRNPSLLKEMSIEHILAENPDFIFVIPMGNSDVLAQQHLDELVGQNPAWAALDAVQNGRHILLPKEGFLYKPNNRWADSYRYLAEVLYGGE